MAGSHSNLGVLLLDTGRPMEAETEYRRALALRERTAQAYPAAPELRGDVAASHNKLGSLLLRTGRLAEAEAEHRTALALYRKLADENPTILEYGDGLASSLVGLGDAVAGLLVACRRPARATIRRSHSVSGWSARARPSRRTASPWHPRYGGTVSSTISATPPQRRPTPAGTGTPRWAAVAVGREEWFETACCHAADRRPGRAPRFGPLALGGSEAEAAMALLRQAVAMGFRNPGAIRIESALDPLRGRDDFRL